VSSRWAALTEMKLEQAARTGLISSILNRASGQRRPRAAFPGAVTRLPAPKGVAYLFC
jgi:hypothetical protein